MDICRDFQWEGKYWEGERSPLCSECALDQSIASYIMEFSNGAFSLEEERYNYIIEV